MAKRLTLTRGKTRYELRDHGLFVLGRHGYRAGDVMGDDEAALVAAVDAHEEEMHALLQDALAEFC